MNILDMAFISQIINLIKSIKTSTSGKVHVTLSWEEEPEEIGTKLTTQYKIKIPIDKIDFSEEPIKKEEKIDFYVVNAGENLKWIVVDVTDVSNANIIDVGFESKEEANTFGNEWLKKKGN